MPRYFKKMSLEEFKSKLMKEWQEYSIKNKYVHPEHLDSKIVNLTKKIGIDLSKVGFSHENFDCDKVRVYNRKTEKDDYIEDEDNKIMGFCTLPNGMPFLGFWAAGDWENIVFGIIYYSGKEFRGYIPKNGNVYNTKTNEAYGNDSKEDFKNIKKRFGITLERDDDGEFEVSDCPDWNVDEIINDIQNRIKEKV